MPAARWALQAAPTARDQPSGVFAVGVRAGKVKRVASAVAKLDRGDFVTASYA